MGASTPHTELRTRGARAGGKWPFHPGSGASATGRTLHCMGPASSVTYSTELKSIQAALKPHFRTDTESPTLRLTYSPGTLKNTHTHTISETRNEAMKDNNLWLMGERRTLWLSKAGGPQAEPRGLPEL